MTSSSLVPLPSTSSPGSPPKKRRPLKHAEEKQKPLKLGVFDLETVGLGGDFLGAGLAWFDDDGQHVYQYVDSVTALLDIMSLPEHDGRSWYAHNGGKYDMLYLIGNMMYSYSDQEIEPIVTGGRCIALTFTYKDMKIQLRDSIAVLGAQSLAKITKAYAPAYVKKDFDHERVTWDPTNPEHQEYLLYDCLGLLYSLKAFETILWEKFHINMKLTSASCSMAAFKRTIAPDVCYWRPHPYADKAIRDGYYGGAVPVLKVGDVPNVSVIDVNSMYPAQMKSHEYPVGSAYAVTRIYPHSEYPGVYRVIAHCPADTPITVVPHREIDRGGLSWPTGDFETTIDSVTLELGLRHGYTFDFIEGYVWGHTAPVFDDFVALCENLRNTHKGTAVELAAKNLQNTLYGKFGTKPVRSVTKFTDNGLGMFPVLDERGNEIPHLYSTEEEVDEAYMLPHWAMFTTAWAREYLFESMYAIGPEHIAYGDTDSIHADHDAIMRAVERGDIVLDDVTYGAFKLEVTREQGWYGGPKKYIIGKKVKSKGQPLSRIKDFSTQIAIVKGDADMLFTQTRGILQVMRGRTIALSSHRKSSDLAHSHAWVLHQSVVRPVHMVYAS